ncbi:MAG TPA: hypothetical protein VJZ71_12415 [Phycisphaerae bacterium]|nr:hypothetical protein [Phycisphaerae bacterium]
MTDEENALKTDALASRVRQAYERCSFFSFEATTKDAAGIRRVEMAMTPSRYKTRVYLGDKLIWVGTRREEIYEEWKPSYLGYPQRRHVERFTPPVRKESIELMEGIEQHTCSMGGYLDTWLGPDSRRVGLFDFEIRKGRSIGVEDVDVHKCEVVATPPNERYGVMHVLYVRPDGFVARWDSYADDEGTARFIRSRVFQRIRTEAPSIDVFEFEDKDTQWTRLP